MAPAKRSPGGQTDLGKIGGKSILCGISDLKLLANAVNSRNPEWRAWCSFRSASRYARESRNKTLSR